MQSLPDYPELNAAMLQELKTQLYRKPVDKLNARMQDLIRKNSRHVGNDQACFIYRNRLFGGNNYQKGIPPRPTNMAHREILPQIREWLDDEDAIKSREMPYVVGYIQRVMNQAKTLEDYQALLPESLHGPVRKFAPMFPADGMALSQEQLTDFLTTNDRYLNMVKQRMMTNLLL